MHRFSAGFVGSGKPFRPVHSPWWLLGSLLLLLLLPGNLDGGVKGEEQQPPQQAPPRCPDAMKDQCSQAETCFTTMCDETTKSFTIPQCEQALGCSPCFPDSACSGREADSEETGGDDNSFHRCDPTAIGAKASALAEELRLFNLDDGRLLNSSACAFQELLSLGTSAVAADADAHNEDWLFTPIHVVAIFRTKNAEGGDKPRKDTRIASALSSASRSVGGSLVLRNRVLGEANANYAAVAGFPNLPALQELLTGGGGESSSSPLWSSFVEALASDADLASLSVVPLNVDVRPTKPGRAGSPDADGVDCAYKPASAFDPGNRTLPWPIKPVVAQANDLILADEETNKDLEGVGGLFEVLNFNKVLPTEPEEPGDYANGVAIAGLRHGFQSEPKFGCIRLRSIADDDDDADSSSGSIRTGNSAFCRSLQLAGTFVMGYDDVYFVQYPSARAFLGMLNDPNWDPTQKINDFAWSEGILSMSVYSNDDDIEVTIPQSFGSSGGGGDEAAGTKYIGGDNFEDAVGFPLPSTPCSDGSKLALVNDDIANNDDCVTPSSDRPNVFLLGSSMVDRCASFLLSSSTSEATTTPCPKDCANEFRKYKPCYDPLPNTYNVFDAAVLRSLHLRNNNDAPLLSASERTVAELVLGGMSAHGWYRELERRGCHEAPPNQASASSSSSSPPPSSSFSETREETEEEEDIGSGGFHRMVGLGSSSYLFAGLLLAHFSL